jgi:ACS family hexuronate transporter-like MFS transporter
MLGRACTDSIWWFYVFWLPQYLIGSRGFSLRLLATLGWVPFLFADLGNFCGGGASTWLAKHGQSLTRARKAVLLCSGAMMVLVAPATLLPGNAAVISTISAWTFFYAAFSTILLALPSDLFAPTEVGAAAGLCQAGSGAGAIVVQLCIGVLLDHFHSYGSVFALAAFLPLIATVSALVMIPKVDLLRRTDQTASTEVSPDFG